MSGEAATAIRDALWDPLQLAGLLGLLDGKHERTSQGVLVCCPAHGDRTPSCHVRRGDGGLVVASCFGCHWSGDAIALVAAVRGLDLRRDYGRALEEAAVLAGAPHLAELGRIEPSGPRHRRETPRPQLRVVRPDETMSQLPQAPQERPPMPARDYPPVAEVNALWEAAKPANDDTEASGVLALRRIDPDEVTRLDLARVIHGPLPWWASKGERCPETGKCLRRTSWEQSGHRLIVPVYDHTGTMRSVRAWATRATDQPKRLPPAGHLTRGLVMANQHGRALLAGDKFPGLRIFVAEGEPDFLTMAIIKRGSAVIGVYSGSWQPEHAANIPPAAAVIVASDEDPAGDKHFEVISKTLPKRQVRRA